MNWYWVVSFIFHIVLGILIVRGTKRRHGPFDASEVVEDFLEEFFDDFAIAILMTIAAVLFIAVSFILWPATCAVFAFRVGWLAFRNYYEGRIN